MENIQDIPVDNMEVVTILVKDVLVCKNWRLFCKSLEFEGSVMYDLGKMESCCSITDVIINILAHWKNISTKPNLRILSVKLREIGCNAAAEKVEALGVIASIRKSDLIWFNVLSPTTFYTGRSKEMLEIEKQWKKCEESKTMMIVAVTGLGGIGKSEIAKMYAKTFYENIKGHCIWIDSETNQALFQNILDLAQEIKIPPNDESGKEKGLKDLVKEIYEKISDEKCLIIFDNMESYENAALSQLMELSSKKAPNILKPLILVTSRFRPAIKFFGDDKCLHLELNILSTESASVFFHKSLKLSCQDSVPDSAIEAIEKLCNRLENYPLAMQQAAAYIKQCLSNNSTNLESEIQKYLHEIEMKSKLILDHELPEGKSVGKKITFLTWRITMSKIEEITEIGISAVRMMNIISFLASENISTEFLSNILVRLEEGTQYAKSRTFLPSLLKFFSNNSKSRTEEIPKSESTRNYFEILRDHSMISLYENKIWVHRLVQEVTRIELIERGKFLDCLCELLTCIQKMLQNDDISGNHMIHTEMIWEHACNNADLVRKHANIPTRISCRYIRLKKYREAYNFSFRALTSLERILGEKDRSTLKLKFWKGSSLEYLGEYKEALEILTDVHEKQMKLFGEADDHCLTTAKQIGGVHWKLQNYEDSLKWLENVLTLRERIKGKAHHETLSVKHNIANVLEEQGNYKEAQEMYQQILEVLERECGLEHPRTLSALHAQFDYCQI